jgi:hypothetical protein
MPHSEPAYLWLTRWAPYPPRRGGDIDYSRDLVHALAEQAPVHGIVFQDGGAVPAPRPGLTWSFVDQPEPPRLASLVSPLPNVAFRHAGQPYLRAAIAAARNVEAVFIDFISLFWLVAPLRKALDAAGGKRPLIIVVNHNFEHGVRRQMVAAERAPAMRAALAYDTWKAGRLERQANRLADGLIALTPGDRAQFETLTDKPGVVILPAYAGPRAPPRLIEASLPPRICILGNHEAHHKRMVLERTLEALSAKGVERLCPIDVVGGGETDSFQARFPDFHFHGYMEDLEAYLRTVRLGLIPDEIGGGFKIRALTHAFQRLPMLAVRSALSGMGFTAEVHYAQAETVHDMAGQIPGLVSDFARLNRLQQAAFSHCERAFDWSERGRALHDFVQNLPRPGA